MIVAPEYQTEPIPTEMVELSRGECLRLLAVHNFGRVVVKLGDGPPLIRPVNYVFDESSQSVMIRMAAGSKFRALLRSANATFEIDGIGEGARIGWSVIIQGVTAEVTNPNEVRRLDSLGLVPLAPGPKPHWVQIRARTVSGRQVTTAESSLPGYYLG